MKTEAAWFPRSAARRPKCRLVSYAQAGGVGETLLGHVPDHLVHTSRLNQFAVWLPRDGGERVIGAVQLGHSLGTITSRYIHTIDAALVMAADTVAGYIQGMLDGVTFKRNAYSLDQSSREAALARLFDEAKNDQKPTDQPAAERQQAA